MALKIIERVAADLSGTRRKLISIYDIFHAVVSSQKASEIIIFSQMMIMIFALYTGKNHYTLENYEVVTDDLKINNKNSNKSPNTSYDEI